MLIRSSLWDEMAAELSLLNGRWLNGRRCRNGGDFRVFGVFGVVIGARASIINRTSRAIGSFRDSADNKVNVGLTFRGDGNRGGCFAIDRGWRHRLARCNKRGKPKQIKM
jgi:hypothetical protein